jgi:hypothetical protein
VVRRHLVAFAAFLMQQATFAFGSPSELGRDAFP